jgi:hypothetical protein
MQVIITDIETMVEFFLCTCYDPQLDEWQEFEINKNCNTVDKMVRYFEEKNNHYFITYNGLRFDSQVLEFIIREHDNWHEKGFLEICSIIAQNAADTIHDSNFGILPKYRENQLSFKILDLFEIHHFSNKYRRVSLKRLEFEMDLENIEEMPIHHTKVDMSDEEIQMTKEYCKNDVMATYEFYKVTIGETEHPLYKGNNQIELRMDIQEEFGIPCLNYSDSKIGDEMIKKYYCIQKGIPHKDLPKRGTFRKPFTISSCMADYIEFKTPKLKDFLKRIKKVSLSLQDDFKEQVEFYGNMYTFAKGGLHTENSPKIFEADDDHLIVDWDVSSYYPAIIINNGRYPAHLGKEFLAGYKQMFEKRLELKPLAKKDKKIKGIVGALKLAVNSVYGKSSDMQSWIYDRKLTMFTTITGELSLLMLIEQYELAGINVISANTDGVTIMVKKDSLELMKTINEWWMNLTSYELERTDYQKIIFSTVNDYLAIKTDGEVKKKGDFLTDFELHKNKSARVCAIALEQYFVHNVSIEQTIRNHNNIYDFCLRQKSSKDFHYEGVDKLSGRKTVYNKLIRYYVSTNGEKLLKVKNEDCETNAAEISQVEAGDWVMRVCNYLPKNTDVATAGVNYDYYIERANRIVHKIQTEGKKRKVVINPNQISLF